nr:gamma-interferon-inducible lysosomal thiol reductase isoform X2 [Hydra vulgaris]
MITKVIFLACFSLISSNGEVNVDIFFESKCPDSIKFIEEQLWPTYQVLDKDIVSFKFYPYGNAHTIISQNETISFECQHGPQECLLNTVEACVINQTPTDVSIKFIYCLEKNPTEKRAKRCSEYLKIDWKKLTACYNGLEGKNLLRKAGEATPTHTFIPWIVVDGDSDESIQEKALSDLLKLVCEKYYEKSGTIPRSCY